VNDQAERTSVFEIRVRSGGLCPESWMTIEDKPADIEQARKLACRWSQGLAQPGGTIPAEVLVVGQWGPVDRWLDGHRAALESLTPGHPGGCTCGECIVRWEHREGKPGHKPCGHGICPLCDICLECEAREREEAHANYIAVLVKDLGQHVDDALSELAKASWTLLELTSNEVYDIELAESSDGADALADLEDAARAARRARRIVRDRQRLLVEEG
jgi:hypothetical protein